MVLKKIQQHKKLRYTWPYLPTPPIWQLVIFSQFVCVQQVGKKNIYIYIFFCSNYCWCWTRTAPRKWWNLIQVLLFVKIFKIYNGSDIVCYLNFDTHLIHKFKNLFTISFIFEIFLDLFEKLLLKLQNISKSMNTHLYNYHFSQVQQKETERF